MSEEMFEQAPTTENCQPHIQPLLETIMTLLAESLHYEEGPIEIAVDPRITYSRNRYFSSVLSHKSEKYRASSSSLSRQPWTS